MNHQSVEDNVSHDYAPKLSRRGFFRKTSVAVLSAAAGQWQEIPAQAGRSAIRFGLTTYQWGRDWDVPTLIANCRTAQVFGVELRTSERYAHGVELELSAQQRSEVKKRFNDSPIRLIGLACGERFDWPDPEKLKAAIEKTKGYLKLSQDVGGSGLRVFPNDFHPDIPREKTIEQIAEALKTLAPFAADCGQWIRLEAHGTLGELANMQAILQRVDRPRVVLKLNSAARDTQGAGFAANFNLVKPYLGDTVHIHELDQGDFPYQLQLDLLVQVGWIGWQLLEATRPEPDRVRALITQREIWEKMLARSMKS